MKSNTEVYSQWLDSKVVLEPTHPPGGQLNHSTMMASFTAAEEQDQECEYDFNEEIELVLEAREAVYIHTSNIAVIMQNKLDLIKELKEKIEILEHHIQETEGGSDTTTEDLNNAPSSKRRVGQLTPQRNPTEPQVQTSDTPDEKLPDIQDTTTGSVPDPITGEIEEYVIAPEHDDYVNSAFRLARYAADTWTS